jgi:hypothetical protein
MEKISLDTFYKLFTYECKKPIGEDSKQLYIHIIFKEFMNRKCSDNSTDRSGFEIEKINYCNFFDQICLDELNAAGLISIDKTIKVYPMWLKYLEVENPNQIKLVTNYIDDLQSQSFKESICMKNSFTIDSCNKLITEFIKEQEVLKSTYYQASDVLRHCANWIAKKPKNKNISTSNKL